MDRQLRFQDPGEGIHEGEIRDILVHKGDQVREGQEVLIVETDKAAFEVSAPFSGVVSDVVVHPGDRVHVGDPLMSFGESRAEPQRREAADQPATDSEQPEREQPEPKPPEREQPEPTPPEPAQATDAEPREPTEERREEARESASEPEPPKSNGKRAVPIAAAPSTRRLARELGVDLARVQPTGEAGRITDDDVRAAAPQASTAEAAKPSTQRALKAEREESSALPDFEKWGPVDREPLRSIRGQTARHMQRTWSEVPNANHQDSADVTELEALRRRLAPKVEARGGKLTLSVLTMKAVGRLLEEFPRFNASLDSEHGEVILKRYVHIGLAVDTDRGLIVPVVRDVKSKALFDLAREVTELADRARRGETSLEELAGGTFTITNIGSLGGTSFVPLVNYPEVAILGLARARIVPVVHGDVDDYELRARLMLPLSLSFDHRVVDGADAARFMSALISVLSDPEIFMASI